MYGHPYAMTDPRRDHYLPPAAGPDTKGVIDAAIESLGKLRGFGSNRDATTDLHLLASILTGVQERLPRAVADARDYACSWAGIADLLGVTRASAWQRFAAGPSPAEDLIDPRPHDAAKGAEGSTQSATSADRSTSHPE